MQLINYYTKNTGYEAQSNGLRKSLEVFDEPLKSYTTHNLGSWELNCAQKSYIIGLALEETDDDIFYVDSDCTFVQKPTWNEFQDINVPSFIIHEFDYEKKRYWELISCAIYFPNNELSRKIIKDWRSTQEKYPYQWDQQVLQAVIDQKKFPFVPLPKRWCVTRHMGEVHDPIIIHNSISNQLKDKINGKS